MKTLLAASLLLLSLSCASFAQVMPAPTLLNYSGRLVTPTGNPVPDGTYSVRFSLWTAATAGTEKWNQTIANAAVKNGTFAVLLNANTAGLFDGDLWFEMKIGNDAALAPRQRLASVAYAMKANTVPDNAITNAKIVSVDWSKITGAPSGTGLALPYSGSTNSEDIAFSVFNVGGGDAIFASATFGSGGYFTTSDGFASLYANGTGYHGVYGETSRANGFGVYGAANSGANAVGVYGNSTSGKGVFGNSASGTGGYFRSNSGYAGDFKTESGLVSLYAENAMAHGTAIQGVAADLSGNLPYAVGVHGKGDRGVGVYGESTSYIGVSGRSNYIAVLGEGVGVYGEGIVGRGNYYAGAFYGNINVTGNIYHDSDLRYKTHIATFPNALDTILNLRGVTFDWKRDEFKDKNFGAERQIGFIAQEVEKVLPELVMTNREGYKSVNYPNVVPILVEAVKTLKKDNDEMKSQLAALAETVRQLQATRNK